MPLPFDEQIALVNGKINHVNMADDFARYRDGYSIIGIRLRNYI
jgi:hypothetical protein